MFQEGGEATPSFSIVDPGKTLTAPRFSTRDSLYFSTPQIVSESFDIVQDETGQFYGQLGENVIPIDMAYGNTPREALRNMEKERGIQELRNIAISVASIVALKKPITSGAKGIGGMFYKPKPKGIDFLSGPAGVEIATGSLTPLSKGAITTSGLGLTYLAGSGLADAAITTPDEEVEVQTTDNIAESLNELSSQPSIKTSTEVAEETSTEPSVEVKNSKVTTEEDEDEVGKIIQGEATPPKNYQASFLGNPNFVRLLRNLSKGLATAETTYQGLALGAAGAAEERAAEEALLSEREFEMEKAGIKAASDIEKEIIKKGLDSSKAFREKQAEYETDLSNAAFEYDTSDAVIQAIKEARSYVQTGNVTGLTPLIGEYIRKAKAFVGFGGSKLTDREIAKNLINDIINGNIKELTGESGRTISNLDRQVAANLIGAIDWSADQATVLQKLQLAEDRARKRKENSYKNYLAARKPFENAGYKVPSRFDINLQQTPAEQERIRIQLR